MPSIDELAAATRTAIVEPPQGRDAEALAAWLLGWQHHWPASFAAAFAGDGAALLAWASGQFSDDGRYLKLRRLAIANLATIL